MESNNINIGIISTLYLPHLGGVERYTHNLALNLSKKRFNITIITSRLNDMKEYETGENITIYRLPCFACMDGRMPIIKYNRDFIRSIKKLNEIKFDIMIINTRLYMLSCWGAKYCAKRRIRMLLIEHGTAHMVFNNRFVSMLGEMYEHFLTLYIKKYCNEFYGVSEACNKWLLHFNIASNGVLYNAIDLSDYNHIRTRYRKKYHIGDDAIVITYVGRLVQDKGVLKLLEAFKRIEKTCVPIYLFVAGDGDLAETVKKYVSASIFYLGSISHESVLSLLYETNIYCLPTDYPEGLPTGVLEAAMCECCIVATNAGGTKEFMLDNVTGKVIYNNTIKEITDIFNQLSNCPDIVREMAINARQRVLEKFTWKQTISKLINILEE